MKQVFLTEARVSEDALADHDDLRDVLCHLEHQGHAISAADRWGRLRQRIIAYQALQALMGHVSTHSMELRSATLLLRPWSCVSVPIM
jgi:hypothetical protein